MRSRERRFLGKAREWQIICQQCRTASKTIRTGRASSLPPKTIVKKLMQAGWQVGDNPKHDLCPECIRRPVKAHIEVAVKALDDAMAPMVAINGEKRVHFTELKVAASALDAERAKELIEVLRQQIPPKPQKKTKAEPPPKMAQSEYENWLNKLDQLKE